MTQSGHNGHTCLHRDNLRLMFILGDETAAPLGQVKEHINSRCREHFGVAANEPFIDFTICLYGTICHIHDSKTRLQTIRMLGEVTRDEVLISPNTFRFLTDGENVIADYDPETNLCHYTREAANGNKLKIPYIVYNGNADINQEIARAGFPIQFLTTRAASVTRPDHASLSMEKSFAELVRTGTSDQPIYDYAIFNARQIRDPNFTTDFRINDAMGRFQYLVSPEI